MVGGRELAARCEVRLAPSAGPRDEPANVDLDARSPAAAIVADELRSLLATGLRSGPLGGALAHVVAATVDGGDLATGEVLLQQAAAKALRLAVDAAGLVVLEPAVDFEVWAPEASGAAVLADLGARGADLQSVSSGQLGARLRGTAPLSRMLGYVTKLRSITRGLGQVSLRPREFVPAPPG